MNIFMTGATGYIGGTIARRLLDDGHETAWPRARCRRKERSSRLSASSR